MPLQLATGVHEMDFRVHFLTKHRQMPDHIGVCPAHNWLASLKYRAPPGNFEMAGARRRRMGEAYGGRRGEVEVEWDKVH